MTSSDAPQPPGGPMRQDDADGGFAPGETRSASDEPAGADGSAEERSRSSADDSTADERDADGAVPPVSGDRPEQSGSAQAEQEENAETSLDQPSS